ncbi:GAF domain-containing SpoIIE family protein phosphatase [Pseudonocardia phyllosphaerae]|uniref:GAF domain-containing SpoIIE family protein phosphatase n=1 Tax=Pseudonocardia phyllosphaerae TaxID=3390502 RepID=UPI00397E7277
MGDAPPELREAGSPAAGRGSDVLWDPDRLRALELTGLGARPDEEMDRFAAWVRRDLQVPTGTVSLVRAEQQVYPGLAGVDEPMASERATAVGNSYCRHVVASAEPLVMSDAATDPRVEGDEPALPVGAYAGFPLTDAAGHVLGALCAVDPRPREWTEADLETLADIARCCSTELRLRLARYDHGVQEAQRAELAEAQQRAHDRSRNLLHASHVFSAATTVQEVHAGIDDVLRHDLRPDYADTLFQDQRGRLHRAALGAGLRADPALGDVDLRPGCELVPRDAEVPLTARLPGVIAVRENRIVHVVGREDMRDYPPEALAIVEALGLETVVAAPIPGDDGAAGSIVLGWDSADAVDASDVLTIATIAGYAGQALARARAFAHRSTVAHQLQNALLTVLPRLDRLPMAARYIPADSRLNVGGDWYDVTVVSPPGGTDERCVSISVGDVIGHDLPAVNVMGQVRSMLRQATWDHPTGEPSTILSAFERADDGLGLGAAGTALLAHLHRRDDGRLRFVWSNAGHPPPILLLPDGGTEILDAHDVLFGFSLTEEFPRTDYERIIDPGSTLVLYTDGLVERRGSDLDAGTETLVAAVEAVRDRSPAEIVDAAIDIVQEEPQDDVVVLAIRFDDGG